jgi:hypothetical protein
MEIIQIKMKKVTKSINQNTIAINSETVKVLVPILERIFSQKGGRDAQRR